MYDMEDSLPITWNQSPEEQKNAISSQWWQFWWSQESIMAKINAEEQKKKSQPEVDLQSINLHIQPTVSQATTAIDFTHQTSVSKKNIWNYHTYRKITIRSFLISIISGLIIAFGWLYMKYFTLSIQPIPDVAHQKYLEWYKKSIIYIDNIFHMTNYDKYTDISLEEPESKQKIQDVIHDTTLSYIQKKDLIQQSLDNLIPMFQYKWELYQSLQEWVSKYWFFPEELYNIIQKEWYDIDMKSYLLSMEIIKFTTAIKVFSYLESFISNVAQELQIPPKVVEEKMQQFVKQWEKDVVRYLNACYLNPYEIDYDCTMIGDFDKYYQYFETKNSFDSNFFKKMMRYIDIKLEWSQFPSFRIFFKKYDPIEKIIHFTIEINTFQQDEIALVKKWIINPHIFILSNVINLLKQSRFIISESIDAKSVKIVPKTIKIWSSVFQVNTSTLEIRAPIQNIATREISDYVDNTFNSFE